MQNAIELQKIAFSFHEKLILRNLSLTIPVGEVHVFLGPNGSGKSTLIKVIAGLLTCKEGEVKVFGKTPHLHKSWASSHIGLLSDKLPLYEEMTVVDYLQYLLHLRVVDQSSHKLLMERAIYIFELQKLWKLYIGKLSFGQKQRVAMAQAMIHDPDLLLLDEPTVGLDPEHLWHVRDYFKQLKGKKTLCLASHQLSEVEQVADKISFIKEGSIIDQITLSDQRFHEGPPLTLEQRYRHHFQQQQHV